MTQIALAEHSAANGVEIELKAYLVQQLGVKNHCRCPLKVLRCISCNIMTIFIVVVPKLEMCTT